MNKQIDEIRAMAKFLACNVAWDEDEIPTVNCLETANRLYVNGYRKASDVAREIFEEIEDNSYSYGVNFVISKETLAELKKKYESEGEE